MPTPTHKLRSSLPAALLFLPLLASADSFSNGVYPLLAVALVAVAAIPLLLIMLALRAYWSSGSKAWQTANAVGLVISLVAGALWEVLSGQSSLTVVLQFNPFWQLSAPVAAWLGGMVQARADVRPRWRIAWVALAVVGARHLLGAFHQLSFMVLAAQHQAPSQLALKAAILQVLTWILSFGVWLLVLRQVQRQHPLNWHGADQLTAPAVATAVGLGLTLASFLLANSVRNNMFTPAILGTSVLWAVIGFGIGVLAIWIDQGRRYVPGEA